jgi:hypothetical protein
MLGDFSGSQELVRIFYNEIKGSLILNLRIFTLQTVFIKRITFVNWGMGVHQNTPPDTHLCHTVVNFLEDFLVWCLALSEHTLQIWDNIPVYFDVLAGILYE